MMRRAHWLAAVGFATLGLAGLCGCQSMGGYPTGSWSGERSLVRAAEPDDPSGLPSLQLHPVQTASSETDASDDPFAPITVEQFLPASSGPRFGRPAQSNTQTATAGYVTPPSTSASNALVPPAPMAVMTPTSPSPLATDAQSWEPHGSAHDSCPTCGHSSGTCAPCTSLVIFAGADYFSNSGMINRDRLFNQAAQLPVQPLDVPDLDPQRTGGMLSINAGAPLTPNGGLAFQVGGTYIEAEKGAQGFFTAGLFHRCEDCDKCGINWGVVYDIAYDDFIDYVIGQIRVKAGYALTTRNEVGGWLAIGTNVETVFVEGTHFIIGDEGRTPFEDVYEARVRPECHGYFFWRHVFMCGAEATIYAGGRENLGGAFVLGYTASVPISDSCAVMGGGHWSADSEDRGSFDTFLGLGYYPGGNARSTGTCGNRYLPYLEPANNTFMPMSIEPRKFILLDVPPGIGDHVPL